MRAARLRATLVCLGVFTALSSAARSNESVTVPGYAPATGVEHSYRVQKATENDMSFWFDKSGATPLITRGDFRQKMTVLSRDEQGMRVRWSLSADLPNGIGGAADTYQMNLLYRNSLTAYGVSALELETDLNGYPRSLPGADQILAHMRQMAANGPGGAVAVPESSVDNIIDRIEQNPVLIVTALVPEAQLLASGQSYQDEAMEVGQALAASRNEDYGGVSVPVTSTWVLDSTDAAARTATLSVTDAYDPAVLSQSQQEVIAKLMAAFDEQVKSLTADQLASVRRADKKRIAKFVVSLNDGSVVEASEVVTIAMAGTTLRTYTYMRREDVPASLQVPPILTAAVQPTPNLHVEPLPPVNAGPGVLDELSTSEAPAEQDTAVVTSNDQAKSITPIWLEVKSAEVVSASNPYGFALNIVLTPESAEKFRAFTQAAIGRQVQIVINDNVVMEPWIRQPVTDGRLTIDDGPQMKVLGFVKDRLSVPGAKILVRPRS
ncbi:SecDF P1 head subdomain-containing protein [Rhizobium sp. A22-96]